MIIVDCFYSYLDLADLLLLHFVKLISCYNKLLNGLTALQIFGLTLKSIEVIQKFAERILLTYNFCVQKMRPKIVYILPKRKENLTRVDI